VPGRLWPLPSGEHGEYELSAGHPAAPLNWAEVQYAKLALDAGRPVETQTAVRARYGT
jgi:hypothetical protein